MYWMYQLEMDTSNTLRKQKQKERSFFMTMTATTNKVWGINGPVLTVHGSGLAISEMVKVHGLEKPILGEVIALKENALKENEVIIQVYESTVGLRTGALVEGMKQPMSVTIKPGIIGHIFDGITRPLEEQSSVKMKWFTRFIVKPQEYVSQGTIFAEIQETPAITYKAMIPYGVNGTITKILSDGEYLTNEPLLTIDTPSGEKEVTMSQTWAIRLPRPIKQRQMLSIPLITGQRIIDSLFPLAKGGVAAIPGGFGTGKTMTQHQLAKWCDADLIVYIGCGERGNEMTEVLEDFAKLIDPRSNQPLLARTVLIANTSDMPVASREASIYTGLAIAEGYRDMGYHCAIMADSTSRWAEALRELSGRLEEIPAEEGYPAYLATRLSAFYGRAGYVKNLNGTEGSISIVGAVSPQGADFSEPVTQHTKRFVRCFWALDRRLAYARHFPAINWLDSYSGYLQDLEEWYNNHVNPKFMEERAKIMAILQEENSLNEIVKLIGQDTLADSQRLTLLIAQVIRTEFVQQNAYNPEDTYMPLKAQFARMDEIVKLHDKCKKLLKESVTIEQLENSDIFTSLTHNPSCYTL